MIYDRANKIQKLIDIIRTKIHVINTSYRTGPDLYFYKKLISERRKYRRVNKFLDRKENVELIYITLLSWDMNSRGAKMRYFDEFATSLLSNRRNYEEIDTLNPVNLQDEKKLIEELSYCYSSLDLMKSSARIVAISKVLHYIFPTKIIPIDRRNTLEYLYHSNGESLKKFNEVNKFAFEVLRKPIKWDNYLDNKWNTTPAKIIDNAIIICVDKSLST